MIQVILSEPQIKLPVPEPIGQDNVVNSITQDTVNLEMLRLLRIMQRDMTTHTLGSDGGNNTNCGCRGNLRRCNRKTPNNTSLLSNNEQVLLGPRGLYT